jgi:hypothetical protein
MAANSGRGKQRNSDELLWLETYFIVFPNKRRPTLAQVEHALAEANPRLKLENLAADDDGLFASLLVQSSEDHAAVEVSYEAGESIIEQNLEWANALRDQLTTQQVQQLVAADARLDLAHFERVRAGGNATPPGLTADLSSDRFGSDYGGSDDEYGDDMDEEAAMEVFDPTCLLTVVEALSTLTKGLTFDPASGEVI